MEYDEKILEKCLPQYLEEDLKKFKEGLKNNDCNEALLRITPLVNIEKINKIIDER